MLNTQIEGGLGRNPGYCHCCRKQTTFVMYNDWLRDYYHCELCHSIPRQRHIMAILDMCFPGWERKKVHESSPSADFIHRYCKAYSSSQFLEGVRPGTVANGVRCENIESLTFADRSFDFFITQDVLEHVFHPDRAIRDIYRVLKPGGAHIFTAPKHKGLLTTTRRASLSDDGSVAYHMDAMYHGNPVGDGRALVTWDYGYDFEQLMSSWAGVPVAAYHTLDRAKGLDAEFNEVFVVRKI
jgi:SAM-dependent methyltransferase